MPADPTTLLHPQARAFLAAMPTGEGPPQTLAEIERLRAEMVATAPAAAGPGPDLKVVQDVEVAGVPCRLYDPRGDGSAPVVVHAHGGGWVTGDLDTHDTVCRLVAEASGWAVLAVDYRRPPEHPYPAALDDVVAVTRAAAAGGPALGVDGTRLALLGDSAGGALVASSALKLRDEGGPTALLQVLVYPCTSPALETPSAAEFGSGFGLEREVMAWFWEQYVGESGAVRDPYAVPAAAASLRGLPPALVITAGCDPLRDEGEAYAAALAEAGVPATATRYLGAVHGFWRRVATFEAAGAAVAQVAGALRGVLG